MAGMNDDPGRRAAADKMRAAGAHAEAIRAFESAAGGGPRPIGWRRWA
jgi:hypothetical protein